MAHNSRVSNLSPDPPKTFTEAEQRFRGFLRAQNYPETIYWLMPGDVVGDRNRRLWVRKREVEGAKYAAQQYFVGLERNAGIWLQAVCATEIETFASVFVPEDDLDAERHMMGRGLKLSCPGERFATSTVTVSLKWRLRWWWNTRRDPRPSSW